MANVKNGDTVKVHYTGKLKTGEVFDSSRDRGEPLEFTMGARQLIPGFEAAVKGMAPGDTANISISSDEAYGPLRDDLIQQVPRSQFPDDVELKEGMQFQIGQEDTESMIVTATEVADTFVTLDANHPLAGKDLEFSIELVEIV